MSDIYAKALRSFDHEKDRKSKHSKAFPVDRSLFKQFEARHLVREATDEEIAELGVAASSIAPPSSAGSTGDTVLTADQFVDGTIPDVVARIDGATAEELKAALEAETAKGDKSRKGVTDALTAAIAGLEQA